MKDKPKNIIKGVERAKKLKDLEIAKALEFENLHKKNIRKKNSKKQTQNIRSDLPKE